MASAREKLHDIPNFGGIDADADSLLRDCFRDHPAYISVRDMDRFLVLGRKGSGKTAIFKRMVTERAPEVFAFGHTFDDYPWHHHDLQAQAGVPEERRYIHSWKYLVLMGLAKILLNSDQSQPWSDEAADALARLEAFVVDSYGSRDPDLSQLFSPEKELHFKTSAQLKILTIDAERIRVKDLPLHVQEVNRAIQEHVLTALNPECQYYVCFDQLDLGFTVKSAEYSQRLTGLLVAAKDLAVATREAGRSFNPIVFLRDDIYQDLQFEDKNKITENFATRVEWSETSEGLSLKELMEIRFSEVIVGSPEAGVAWGDVFDEAFEMPSRQSKYKHICDRTFLRPRDMIKFCNEILSEYQRESSAPRLIDNAAIHAARDRYSDYLLNELDDEIAKHVPSYKDYLEILKALGAEKFEYEEFAEKFEEREVAAEATAKQALEDLFDFSVISYLKPGGRGGGSEYVWRYKDPRARFDSTVRSYRVHPGFKETLGLVR
jgi:hypothetical protein